MGQPEDFRRQVFIEWLCTPKRDREPPTQEAFAEQHGLEPALLTRWKRDRSFLDEWERHYLSTIGSPERKQNILDTMYRTGTDADDPRHVQAGAKYMELVEGLKPQRLDVHHHGPVESLSEAQIDEMLARERERRIAEAS
jgi:hypothetical protein